MTFPAATGLVEAYLSSGSGVPSGTFPSGPAVQTADYGLYQDTATGLMYYWNRLTGAWAALAGTTGAMVQLATTTLGGTAATIDFPSISSAYNHLRLVFQVRLSEAVTDDYLWLRLNADTGANYSFQTLNPSNTSVASSGVNAGTKFVIGDVPANTGLAGRVGTGIIDLPFYAGTTFDKNMHSRVFGQYAAATNGSLPYLVDGAWAATAAINEITLLLTTSTFAVGSQAVLYGVL